MQDLLAAVGVALVLEGLLWAGVPASMRRLAQKAQELPPSQLRQGGLAAMVLGVAVVWVVRG
ncbi:MAG: DUF2065 domain-containing protein [Geminicoccaceae bacterium]